MGKTYDTIDETVRQFVDNQKMFFVATAPLAKDGLVNLSPKGLESFTILDERTVAYADLTGSGIETVAHVKENGRIVVMFCSFDRKPLIMRFHGMGEVIEPGHADFDTLRANFPDYAGLRSIIKIRCHRISDSCGFGVPRYEYQGERSQLLGWADTKGVDGVVKYQRDTNATSLDGLPGISQRVEGSL